MGGRIIARGIALGIAAMALNVAFAFAWVWVYSVAIDPGHDGAFYQAYAQQAAPICAIVAGFPILLAAGWRAARGAPSWVAGLVPAASYVAIDLALSAAGGLWPPFWAAALSWISKLVAGAAGGALAARGQEAQ